MTSLYQNLLGASWAELAENVRAMHTTAGAEVRGHFTITHGTRRAARWAAWAGRLPAAGAQVPVTLRVTTDARGRESWQRNFGGTPLITQQLAINEGLAEKLGILWLLFDLSVAEGALHYQQKRAWLGLGPVRVPVPHWAAPRIAAREWAEGEGTQVLVEVSLPVLGPLITSLFPLSFPFFFSSLSPFFFFFSLQCILGAWDTLYYHEWRARLPVLRTGATELRLHAARDFIYGIMFATLPWLAWRGWLAGVLALLMLAEIFITLADFVTEDTSRRPLGGVFPGERIMHAVMGIVYGAMLAYFVPIIWDWWQQPTGILWYATPIPYWLRWVLTGMAGGVILSGIRDAMAARSWR